MVEETDGRTDRINGQPFGGRRGDEVYNGFGKRDNMSYLSSSILYLSMILQCVEPVASRLQKNRSEEQLYDIPSYILEVAWNL